QLRASELSQAMLPSDPTEFLETGDFAWDAAKQAIKYAEDCPGSSGVYSLSAVELGPPILRPKKIIAVGLNYRNHILEMGRDLPTHPVIFAKFSNTLLGPYSAFPWCSDLTKKLDYEGELAFVISRRAKRVPRERAFEYVAGYTIANDLSARDLQKRTIQWLQGKSLDGSLPLGPYLVTRDEVADPHNLSLRVTVNGEERQRATTSELVFGVDYLVSFLSHIMTLDPGDIVLTGTPGGVGEARNVFLQDGDVVRVEIEKLGWIETRIEEVRES
ncbi:fumarylacetoacetate hydrolase family protein, partial [Alicyclobacillus sendaiensis]